MKVPSKHEFVGSCTIYWLAETSKARTKCLTLCACLQGHSLGGSLGTLLMMMYKHRGVLPQTAIAPVYTFGAPAIFCEGACCAPCKDGSGFCDLTPPSEADADAAAASTHLDTSATEPVTDNDGHLKSQGILQALGLEAGCVRNIFMSKDIVPRAFACDYTLVADLLRRVGEGFREHDCLTGNGRYTSCMHPSIHLVTPSLVCLSGYAVLFGVDYRADVCFPVAGQTGMSGHHACHSGMLLLELSLCFAVLRVLCQSPCSADSLCSGLLCCLICIISCTKLLPQVTKLLPQVRSK